MSLYFNEFDPFAAEWLRKLYPEAVVDDRSIHLASADDVTGYTRVHLFGGIGGWEYALRLAGWPDDQPVWTGSCPCQPFSNAGNRRGVSDERHLWPEMYRLISECRPPVVFGEQVASRLGREWLSGVRTDLETLGYAVGAADLCAACVGAPHIRQRLYWVGHTRDSGPQGFGVLFQRTDKRTSWSSSVGIECRDGKTRRIPVEPGFFPLAHGVPARVGRLRGYGNAIVPQVAAAFIRAFTACWRY